MRFLIKTRMFYIAQALALLAGCLPESCQLKLEKLGRFQPEISQIPQKHTVKPQSKYLKPDPWPGCTSLYSEQLSGTSRIIFVDKNAAEHGEGGSWDKPSKSIAYALKLALNQRNLGDSRTVYIIIAGGTYGFDHESSYINLGSHGSIVGFSGLDPDYYKNIHILGGYKPHDPCLQIAENIEVLGAEGRQVILDGELKSNHVVHLSRAENIVFKDLTIRRGHARVGTKKGGGILIEDVSTNIVLERIKVSESQATLGGGLAIYGTNSIKIKDIELMDVMVDRCQANNGGGIYMADAERVNISRAIISNNRAKIGGGIVLFFARDVQLNDSMIEHNILGAEPAYGAGIAIESSERIDINGGSISFNESKVPGYGIGAFIRSFGGISQDIKFLNTVIDGNKSSAKGDSNGLGLCIQDAKIVSLENVILRNHKDGRFGGGLVAQKTTNLKLKSVKAYDNTADFGGGAYFTNSEVTISGGIARPSSFMSNSSRFGGALHFRNVTDASISHARFEQNHSLDDGGAIYVLNLAGTMEIKSTTISDNSSGLNAGGIYIDGGKALAPDEKPYQQLVLIDSEITDSKVTNAYFQVFGSAGIYATNLNSIVLNGVSFLGNEASNVNNSSFWAAALMFLDRASPLPKKNPAYMHDVAVLLDPFVKASGAMYTANMPHQPFQILGSGIRVANNVTRMYGGQSPGTGITSGISIPAAIHPKNNPVTGGMKTNLHYLLWQRIGTRNAPVIFNNNTPPVSGLDPLDHIKTH
jgi:predicted outer membrane repeat protein